MSKVSHQFPEGWEGLDGCDLSNFDKPEKIQTEIVDRLPGTEKRWVKLRFTRVWGMEMEKNQKSIERTAEGVADTSMEASLPTETVNFLMNRFIA